MILLLLFIVLPIVELYTIIRVSGEIGFLNTLGVMFLVAVLGSWLVRREGFRVWVRFNESVASGKIPAREIVDGVLILGAGALLLTPGFFSDLFGLLMLFPPSRMMFRSYLLRRSKSGTFIFRTGRSPMGDYIDTEGTDIRGTLPEEDK
ncbi:MAG: hypothetical protein RL119_1242 [Actinomycetota bacterium]